MNQIQNRFDKTDLLWEPSPLSYITFMNNLTKTSTVLRTLSDTQGGAFHDKLFQWL